VKIKKIATFETSRTFQPTAERHITKDSNLHNKLSPDYFTTSLVSFTLISKWLKDVWNLLRHYRQTRDTCWR